MPILLANADRSGALSRGQPLGIVFGILAFAALVGLVVYFGIKAKASSADVDREGRLGERDDRFSDAHDDE
jgi:hypothetical protein